MESSRRDLLNDMGEHWTIQKNKQITRYHRFRLTPKTGIEELPKTGASFLRCLKRACQE